MPTKKDLERTLTFERACYAISTSILLAAILFLAS